MRKSIHTKQKNTSAKAPPISSYFIELKI